MFIKKLISLYDGKEIHSSVEYFAIPNITKMRARIERMANSFDYRYYLFSEESGKLENVSVFDFDQYSLSSLCCVKEENNEGFYFDNHGKPIALENLKRIITGEISLGMKTTTTQVFSQNSDELLYAMVESNGNYSYFQYVNGNKKSSSADVFNQAVMSSPSMILEEIDGVVYKRIAWDNERRYHNTHGPAFWNKDPNKEEYYIHGKLITKNQWEKIKDTSDQSLKDWKLADKYKYQNINDFVIKNGDLYKTNSNGDLHAEGGPAIIRCDGDQIWAVNGKNHREDGPGYISGDDSYQRYYWEDVRVSWEQFCAKREEKDLSPNVNTMEYKFDSLDITAKQYEVIQQLGEYTAALGEHFDLTSAWDNKVGGLKIPAKTLCCWYQDRSIHKKHGPALILPDGTQIWMEHNNVHREDGPAIIHADGREQLFLHGEEISPKSEPDKKVAISGTEPFPRWEAKLTSSMAQFSALTEIKAKYPWYKQLVRATEDIILKDNYGDSHSIRQGDYYRWDDEYQCIDAKGDTPCIVRKDGGTISINMNLWWVVDGNKTSTQYFHHDNILYKITLEQYNVIRNMGDRSGWQDKLSNVWMSCEPRGVNSIVDANSGCIYIGDSHTAHNDKGPAVICPDGSLIWMKNNQLHRADGPAIIHASGGQEYYINNLKISRDKFIEYYNSNLSKEKIKTTLNKPIIKETKTMSFVDEFTSDGEKAAYRFGARKLSKLASHTLEKILRAQGMKRKEISVLLSLAEKPMGKAAISYGLGKMGGLVPGLKENDKFKRLMEELRVEGMTNGLEIGVDTILPSLIPGLQSLLGELPPPVKVRVDPPKKHKKAKPAPEELEEDDGSYDYDTKAHFTS